MTQNSLNHNSKMTDNLNINATFLIGLPDSKLVGVNGYNKGGQLLYNWSGNSDFHNYIDLPKENKKYLTLIWHAEPERNIKIPNILVNCISDADICKNSLKRAIAISEGIKKQSPKTRIYNDPKNIEKTTRDNIYNQFRGVSEFYIPKTIRIKPESDSEVLSLAKENGIEFPFLIRPCGSHQGEGLQRINSLEDAYKLQKYAFDNIEYYLTEFVDNKHSDGFYRKARIVILGGKMIARHYMTYPEWNIGAPVHYNYMPKHEHTKRTEEEFIYNYKNIIQPKAIDAMFSMYQNIGLDYLGFDIDIMADGRILVYEINVAQNAFLKIDMQNFPYMKKAGDEIIEQLNKSIKTAKSAF